MELEELFCQLSYGQLSNLAISSMGSGEIVAERKPQLTIYTNEALIRLYSRFMLREKDVIVEMVEGVTFYHLLKVYAEQSHDPSTGVYPYIKDLNGERFEEDVIKVHAVYDNNGCARSLNDREAYSSVYTPQYNILQNPNPQAGEVLSLLYQAKHPKLVCNSIIPEETWIEIPDVLIGALCSYVAGMVYGDMNTAESTMKGAEHMARYESICRDAEDRDLVNTSISTENIRFKKNGWV